MEEMLKRSKVFDLEGKKIWVAGHNGMVGSSILRKLKKYNCEILTVERKTVDLVSKEEVESWMKIKKPDVIFLAAAKVGGIYANMNYPTEFLYDNILISFNIIKAAQKFNIKKLIFFGSSCIYPSDSSQPMKEECLLKGELESSNQWYALAKISGIKLCQAMREQYSCDFISIMPTNLYGPNDNFHPANSHVPAALLSRFHKAKENEKKIVTVWGSGKPLREFLHVDDLADASLFITENYSSLQPINVGSSMELSITEFAEMIKDTVGYKGNIEYDTTKPDGIRRKLLECSKITKLGWKPKINLKKGLKLYYKWYLKNIIRKKL